MSGGPLHIRTCRDALALCETTHIHELSRVSLSHQQYYEGNQTMNCFIQNALINTGLVLALGIGATSLSSSAHADKMAVEPSNYAMHMDEIGPAASIGQSTVEMKLKLQAKKLAVIDANELR